VTANLAAGVHGEIKQWMTMTKERSCPEANIAIMRERISHAVDGSTQLVGDSEGSFSTRKRQLQAERWRCESKELSRK
jgi:hypothetical protein